MGVPHPGANRCLRGEPLASFSRAAYPPAGPDMLGLPAAIMASQRRPLHSMGAHSRPRIVVPSGRRSTPL